MTTLRMEKLLIHIENADVSYEGKKVLHGISWDLKEGEHWAVLGNNGAGKSTFLRLVRGDIWPDPKDAAKRIYYFDGEPEETPLGIKQKIGIVTPELQDRYVRLGWDLSGLEVVSTGFSDSVWLHDRPSPERTGKAESLMKKLGIDRLKDRSFREMSQGEARKVLIARALVSSPRLLILDEICNGLDIPSREKVLRLLEDIASSGTTILSASHRMEEFIPSISRLLVLKHGRIAKEVERRDLTGEEFPSSTDLRAFPGPRTSEKKKLLRKSPSLVEVKNASVYLGDRRVLYDINWHMNSDENWVISGKNGAGKSTLLRLITGDLLPALGGEVRWFGKKNHGSIWDVRKRLGLVSPHLQADYSDEMTGEDAVLSGLFSSIGLYDRTTRAERLKARGLLTTLGIGTLGKKKITGMSYGEMRKILIARALINDPDLLILDEPCNGLDMPSKRDFLHFLEELTRRKTRLLLVTHHAEEIIPSITHLLELDKGRVVCQGRRK